MCSEALAKDVDVESLNDLPSEGARDLMFPTWDAGCGGSGLGFRV